MTHFLKFHHYDEPSNSLQCAIVNFLKEINNCQVKDLKLFKKSFATAIESLNDVHFDCKSLEVNFQKGIPSYDGDEYEMICFEGYFVRFYIHKVQDWVINFPALLVSANGTLILSNDEDMIDTNYFTGLFH